MNLNFITVRTNCRMATKKNYRDVTNRNLCMDPPTYTMTETVVEPTNNDSKGLHIGNYIYITKRKTDPK